MQFYLKLSTQSPLEQKICPKEVKTPENRVFYEGYEQTPWKNISVFEAWVLENRSPILN